METIAFKTRPNQPAAKRLLAGAALAAAFVLLPDVASADAAGAIDAAITSGQALIGKVAPGVIGIAAIMTGVGLVLAFIRK